MAEKVASEGAATNRPSALTEPVGSVEELVRNAPEPSENADKIYRVKYPDDRFVMEGMPVITQEGTSLTNTQAEEILPAAEASGVKIVEVGE